jgi:hypothetical protein
MLIKLSRNKYNHNSFSVNSLQARLKSSNDSQKYNSSIWYNCSSRYILYSCLLSFGFSTVMKYSLERISIASSILSLVNRGHFVSCVLDQSPFNVVIIGSVSFVDSNSNATNVYIAYCEPITCFLQQSVFLIFLNYANWTLIPFFINFYFPFFLKTFLYNTKTLSACTERVLFLLILINLVLFNLYYRGIKNSR